MRRMALDFTLSRRQRVDFGAPPQTWGQYSNNVCQWLTFSFQELFDPNWCQVYLSIRPRFYIKLRKWCMQDASKLFASFS